MEKPQWLFGEGTRVMLTFGLTYKNTSSLRHFIYLKFLQLDHNHFLVWT